MSWGPDQIARVRAAADLVGIARKLVDVRQGLDGAPVGICPFHADRAGTLSLDPVEGIYHCTFCGAHGDLFALVQAQRSWTHQEAVQWVANETGIDLQDLLAKRPDADLQAACRRAMELATSFYEQYLWSAAGEGARAYLANRGFSDAAIRQFRLGWAEGGLVDHLLDQGLPAEVLRQADLSKVYDKELGDRFRRRITVPILDAEQRVIAFSARLLPSEEARRKADNQVIAKYINSSDTPIYHKGASVYNLKKARSAARRDKRLLIVEGALDAIACSQAGISAVVAPLGTAFTADQAALVLHGLDSATPLVVALDGDKAGRARRLEVVRQLLAIGASVQVADLPNEGDPAELLLQEDKADREGFERALTKMTPGRNWFLQAIAPNPDSLDDGQRLGLLEQVMALVAKVADPSYRGLVVKAAAKYLGVDQVTAKNKLKARTTADELAVPATERIATTDYGNARRFLQRCGGVVRYCRDWSSWVVWTGKRWEVDDQADTLTWSLYHAAMHDALTDEIDVAVRQGRDAHVRRLRDHRESSDSTASHKAALEQAQRLPELQARSKVFDRDPYLLNVANGTLDLRSGEMLPFSRDHLITRIAEVEWRGANARDARWDAFVASFTSNKSEVAAFLQRYAGYSATGITTEKAIVILQGDGNSGKTVLVKALRQLFGGYAGSLNAENFLAQQMPQKRWELANCDVARFVVIEEVGTEGRGFAIDFLKSATGGNEITGERKHGQPYSFTPIWKLLFVCNDTPSAPAGDNATWNRIHLVHAAPPPDVLDKTLSDHLATPEARSAILAWLVAGARDYLARGGLDAPEAVKLATAKHRLDCDYLMQYLDEGWHPDEPETSVISTEEFIPEFHAWCKSNGHYAPSAKAITKRLIALGVEAGHWVYSTEKKRSVRAWAGLRRRTDLDDKHWSELPRHGSRHGSATSGEAGANVATHPRPAGHPAAGSGSVTGVAPDQSHQQSASNLVTDRIRGEIRGESVASTEASTTPGDSSDLRDSATLATDPHAPARPRETSSYFDFSKPLEEKSGIPDGSVAPPPGSPPSRADRLRSPPGRPEEEDPFSGLPEPADPSDLPPY